MAKGHTVAVDYWSYGVLMFELLTGHAPFSQPGQSHMDMFKKIVTVKYSFPKFVDSTGQDLIQRLLVRKVLKRLGAQKNGYIDIRNHDFFQENGIDMKQLLQKELTAPWIPKVGNPLDAQEFQAFSIIEKERGPGQALDSKEQALFENF